MTQGGRCYIKNGDNKEGETGGEEVGILGGSIREKEEFKGMVPFLVKFEITHVCKLNT